MQLGRRVPGDDVPSSHRPASRWPGPSGQRELRRCRRLKTRHVVAFLTAYENAVPHRDFIRVGPSRDDLPSSQSRDRVMSRRRTLWECNRNRTWPSPSSSQISRSRLSTPSGQAERAATSPKPCHPAESQTSPWSTTPSPHPAQEVVRQAPGTVSLLSARRRTAPGSRMPVAQPTACNRSAAPGSVSLLKGLFALLDSSGRCRHRRTRDAFRVHPCRRVAVVAFLAGAPSRCRRSAACSRDRSRRSYSVGASHARRIRGAVAQGWRTRTRSSGSRRSACATFRWKG